MSTQAQALDGQAEFVPALVASGPTLARYEEACRALAEAASVDEARDFRAFRWDGFPPRVMVARSAAKVPA